MRYEGRRVNPGHMQIGKWSILSDVVKYVQYNQCCMGHYELEVKALEERYSTKKLQNSEREIKEISFDSNAKILKQVYLDIFEGITSAQYEENSDIGTAKLGMPQIRRQDELKAEYNTLIYYVQNRHIKIQC